MAIEDFLWVKKPEPLTVDIKLEDCIIPMYDDVLEDILNHGHTHYVFPGGRGSTKSSFTLISMLFLFVR